MERARREVLHALTEPGCLLCNAERKHLETYLFWFLNEQYHEPETMGSLRSAHGFCPRHTRHLLAAGVPGTLTTVFEYLVTPFAQQLRQLEWRLADWPKGLIPSSQCPACRSGAAHLSRWIWTLGLALGESQVREVLESERGICIHHLERAGAQLGWVGVRAAATSILAAVDAAPDVASRLTALVGADAEARIRGRSHLAAGIPGPEAGEKAWASAMGELRMLLRQPACPLCAARRSGLVRYLLWLGEEVQQAPHRWSDALWLCRTHAWDFAALARPDSLERLARAMAEQWRSRLEVLRRGLAERRTVGRIGRLWRFPQELAHQRRRPLRLSAAAVAAAQEILASERNRREDLLQRALQRGPCPACEAVAVVSDRTSELLAVALGDRTTRCVYEESHAVCHRHLASLLRHCRDDESRRTVLRCARVRMEVMSWALAEAGRKSSWTVRYEGRGSEGEAWAAAASHLTGSGLRDNRVLGT